MEHLWTPWRMSYLQGDGPRPEGCVFCNAAATPDADANTYVLWRGQHHFVILNLYPYNNGHLMVVPLTHVDSIELLAPEALTELMTLTQKAMLVLRAAYNPQGFNIGINVGHAAGAGVPGHVHQHIVPRWNADSNFMSTLANTRVIPEELPQTYERLHSQWLKSSETKD
jgi:ATP adenylyltransferase